MWKLKWPQGTQDISQMQHVDLRLFQLKTFSSVLVILKTYRIKTRLVTKIMVVWSSLTYSHFFFQIYLFLDKVLDQL